MFLTKLTTMVAFSGHVLNDGGCCVASYSAPMASSVVRCGGDWKLIYGPASEALPEEALRETIGWALGSGANPRACQELSRGYFFQGRVASSGNHFEYRGRFLRAVELAKHGLQLPFPPAELNPLPTVPETVLPQFPNHFSIGGAQCSPNFIDIVASKP